MNRWIALALGTVLALTACRAPDGAEAGTVRGQVLAGPSCPVVSDPPDPECADRPVAGAVLVIADEDGGEVARLTTDADGRFEAALPPGVYTLIPQPVAGLMGTASPQQFTIVAEAAVELRVAYDTGIR